MRATFILIFLFFLLVTLLCVNISVMIYTLSIYKHLRLELELVKSTVLETANVVKLIENFKLFKDNPSVAVTKEMVNQGGKTLEWAGTKMKEIFE